MYCIQMPPEYIEFSVLDIHQSPRIGTFQIISGISPNMFFNVSYHSQCEPYIMDILDIPIAPKLQSLPSNHKRLRLRTVQNFNLIPNITIVPLVVDNLVRATATGTRKSHA